MDRILKILIIEDNIDDAFLIRKLLERAGLEFRSKLISEKSEFISIIKEESFDVILSDNSMIGFNALDVLSFLKENNINTPLIIVSGTVSEKSAEMMISEGAFDYLNKSNFNQLVETIKRAVGEKL